MALNLAQALQLADTVLMAAEMGFAIQDRAAHIRGRLKHMAEKGDDVPDEEWAKLMASIGLADEVIEERAAAARAALGQAEPEAGGGDGD